MVAGIVRPILPDPPMTGSLAPKTGKTSTPAPAVSAPPPPPDYSSYSDYGYDAGVSSAPAEVAAPTPMKDVDWFNADALYRADAGGALQDLKSKLAQILSSRDSNYQQLDMSRQELGRNRQEDLLNVGQDFVGRGLGSSGLYAQSADKVAADYSRRNESVDQAGQQLAQQYGQQGSKVDLSQLDNANPAGDMSGLSALFGNLGSLGTQTGDSYQSMLAQLRAQSAARASAPLTKTVGW